MKIRIEKLSLENIDYRMLKPLQGNLKDLPSANYEKLKKSFTEKGLFIPMFVWKQAHEFFLLDGHGRERLFSKEKPVFVGSDGRESYDVPCIVVDAKDLKDAKEKILLISSQFQKITQEGLDEFTFDFEDSWVKENASFDAISGFEMDEPVKGGLTEDEAVPPVPSVPKSKIGDIYQLGSHRVMCGDSTNKEMVEMLLGGGVPVLMVTDPPYGVEYDPDWRNHASRDGSLTHTIGATAVGKVLNDDRADWKEAWALFPGNIAYVWHSAIHASEVDLSLQAAGFEIRSQIIWAKHRFAISRGHYHWQHEPCWYVVRKGQTGNWNGDRSQTTLWEISHNACDTGHGTQKPIECMLRPIENNSKQGELVYDPFLGSGTTLIAAEKTGRTCYGMELSPQYVDVIVKRWEDFTGKQAVKIEA